ncbi:MAG: phosphoribosyltransferase [Nitrososphaerota archaeon]
MLFKDRTQAGQRLAEKLLEYKDKDVIILAIPRGGVVVAYEIAKVLNAPLDLIIPRKIGAPYQPELAIGAVTQDGTIILNEDIVSYLPIPENYIKAEAERQKKEIERRLIKYKGSTIEPNVENKIVIIVDDGIATGATMIAAIVSIRKKKPLKIVVAIPVAPPESLEKIKEYADEIVCLQTPEPFFAIGQFYERFEQLEDEEVIDLLNRSKELSKK